MERDFDYFSRRAAVERQAAMKAAHPLARDAHLRLAERYDEMLSKIAADPASSPVRPILSLVRKSG